MCIVGDECHTEEVLALMGTNLMDQWKSELRKKYACDRKIPPVNRVIDDWTVASPTIGCVRMTTNIRKLQQYTTMTINATSLPSP